MATAEILALVFGGVTLVGVAGSVINRTMLKKGIGAQFIRYTVVIVAIPAAASLAFLGLLTEAMGTIISGAVIAVFAGFGRNDK